MKTIIFLIALTIGAFAADSVVHYDTVEADDNSGISKPNYPNDDR